MSKSLAKSISFLTEKFQKLEENIKNGNVKPEDLDLMIKDAFSSKDVDLLLDSASSLEEDVAEESIRTIRKLLCFEKLPFDGETMVKIVKKFSVLLVKYPKSFQFEFELSWAIANLCAHSSAATTYIINEQVWLPYYVQLLKESQYPQLRIQAAWVLGNAAAHSIKNRDLALESKSLTHLLNAIEMPETNYRDYTWVLQNLFCQKPLPQLQTNEVKRVVQCLEKYINDHDYEVVKNVSMVFAYMSEENDKIEAVHEAQGVCHGLVKLLMYSMEDVIFLALKTIGNIVSAGGEGKQRITSHQALLPNLAMLLRKNYMPSIVRDACRIISETIAGNRKQIQDFIDTKGIRTLVSLTISGRDDEIKRAALDAVSKATSGGSSDQITYLICEGCTDALRSNLASMDPSTVTVCREGLNNINRFLMQNLQYL